jgi:hypothetical protein
MVALNFSCTANGTTAGQQTSGPTTSIKFTGDFNGGTVRVEASDEDANYAPCHGLIFREPGVYNITLYGGWFIRMVLNDAKGPATVAVVVE